LFAALPLHHIPSSTAQLIIMSSFGGEPIQVGYWNMRGLGAPLRAMCYWADQPFQANNHCLSADIDYAGSQWFTTFKPPMKEKNALTNLPYLIDGDVVIAQTNSCLSYLGRKYGLWGNTDLEISQCEQLLCETYDLRGGMVRMAYSREFNEEMARNAIDGQTTSQLHKLDLWLAQNPQFSAETPFLVGGHCTAPDFHLWEMLDQYSTMCRLVLKEDLFAAGKYPNLKLFHEAWLTHPKHQAYLNSKLHALPFNNLGAKFGSTMDRDRGYVKGTDTPHDDASGVYNNKK
jgi:glutathione S-transferase